METSAELGGSLPTPPVERWLGPSLSDPPEVWWPQHTGAVDPVVLISCVLVAGWEDAEMMRDGGLLGCGGVALGLGWVTMLGDGAGRQRGELACRQPFEAESRKLVAARLGGEVAALVGETLRGE